MPARTVAFDAIRKHDGTTQRELYAGASLSCDCHVINSHAS